MNSEQLETGSKENLNLEEIEFVEKLPLFGIPCGSVSYVVNHISSFSLYVESGVSF